MRCIKWAETLVNITRAVEDGKPVIDKDITIGGELGVEKTNMNLSSSSRNYYRKPYRKIWWHRWRVWRNCNRWTIHKESQLT